MKLRWNLWRRDIYESGGRYVVPYEDDDGNRYEREFESLPEARSFLTAIRAAQGRPVDRHEDIPTAQPPDPPLPG